MIGFAMCGSFCTHSASVSQLEGLKARGLDILPIMSDAVYTTDTRFGKSSDLIDKCEKICERQVIHTIKDAEPLGPKTPLECLIICPCTGNTLSKLANGITDTPVCMAAKAHLRSDRPLVISLASNDALSANLQNIAKLLSRKHVYFVPMNQDDPEKKPHSLVADFSLLYPTLHAAFEGRQFRKLFL